MKKPKHLGRVFNHVDEFNGFLMMYTHVIIELADNGQELGKLWIDKEGEIIHSNNDELLGEFVDMENLKAGEGLFIQCGENLYKKYTAPNGQICNVSDVFDANIFP